MIRCRSIGSLCVVGLSLFPVALAGQGSAPVKSGSAVWAHWRGPNHDGHSDDAGAPLTWSEDKNLLWKTPLPGRGNSSPIVWGDDIFLTATSKDGNERYVVCVSAQGGKIRWQALASKGVPPGKSHSWNGYASASCATDGERVYAFFGTPGLFCYDRHGKQLWKHDFGIFTCEQGWGTAASPFLFEDLVIQNCDNDGSKALPAGHKPSAAAPMALVALDKVTGKVRWQTPRNQGRGYSTPRLLTVAGRTELLLNGPSGVWAYDPHTGQEIWHCDRKGKKEQNKFGEPIPVVLGDTLFVPSGRPGPFQAIRMGGAGNVTKTHLLWEVQRKGRDCSSQIVWGAHVYAADNKGNLTCFDPKTGKIVYTERLAPDTKSLASPVAIRGKLVFLLDTGETVVVEPGAKFQVVQRNVLGSGTSLDFAASPAVANGRWYLRSQSHLYCVGDKK
jgi:outer membrane protein assembly factor BamB